MDRYALILAALAAVVLLVVATGMGPYELLVALIVIAVIGLVAALLTWVVKSVWRH